MSWTSPTPEPVDGPLSGPDRPMLEALLSWQRTTLLNICAGLTPEQLVERPIASSSLSLLGLLRHAAKVERIWLRRRAGAEDVEPFYDLDLGPDHDFEGGSAEDAEDAVRLLREEWLDADVAVAAMSFDDTVDVNGEDYSLRMIYIHLIAEYSRHNGHADLLREALDGVTAR